MSSQPAAKAGDRVLGVDTHVVLIPSAAGPVPTPMPMPFNGPIQDDTSASVFIDNQGAACVGSTANNAPPHIPAGGPFQTPPSNRARIFEGSGTVFAETEALARAGDRAECCNDLGDTKTGVVVVGGTTVFAG